MGCRLHVAKRFIVEYADVEVFNYKCNEFHDLLSICGADYTGDSCNLSFEVTKDDWERCILKIRNLDKLDNEEREEVTKCLANLESSPSDTIDIMENILKQSDSDKDVLFLSYF